MRTYLLARASQRSLTNLSVAAMLYMALSSAALPAPEQETRAPFHFPSPDSSSDVDTQPAAATPLPDDCRRSLKRRRVMILVGEQQGGQWLASQDRYLPMLSIIESRLSSLGFVLFTPAQIKAAIAQREIDAYFKNDPDAALAASKKMGADFVLRGVINSDTSVNPVVQVNEVTVTIELTFTSAGGRPLSAVSAQADSYSGTDTLHTALEMVREQADWLTGQVAADYCRTVINRT